MGAGASIVTAGGDGNVSADDVLQYVNTVHKMEAIPASAIQHDQKRMVVGRAVPKDDFLVSPMNRRNCVYYQTLVQQLDPMTGQWRLLFEDEAARDFCLLDGMGGPPLLVPLESRRLVFFGREERGQEFLMPDASNFAQFQALMARYQQNASLYPPGTLRYNETSIDIGEQIGVMAMGHMEPYGMTIKPATAKDFGPGWYKKHHFNNAEENMWENLFRNKAFIATDDPRFMRLTINPIPGLPNQQPPLAAVHGQFGDIQAQQQMAPGIMPNGQSMQMQMQPGMMPNGQPMQMQMPPGMMPNGQPMQMQMQMPNGQHMQMQPGMMPNGQPMQMQMPPGMMPNGQPMQMQMQPSMMPSGQPMQMQMQPGMMSNGQPMQMPNGQSMQMQMPFGMMCNGQPMQIPPGMMSNGRPMQMQPGMMPNGQPMQMQMPNGQPMQMQMPNGQPMQMQP
jgi:hypothetical protein